MRIAAWGANQLFHERCFVWSAATASTPSVAQLRSQCGGTGPSVLVARFDDGSVVGGYSPVDWGSATGLHSATGAFLFSIPRDYKWVLPPEHAHRGIEISDDFVSFGGDLTIDSTTTTDACVEVDTYRCPGSAAAPYQCDIYSRHLCNGLTRTIVDAEVWHTPTTMPPLVPPRSAAPPAPPQTLYEKHRFQLSRFLDGGGFHTRCFDGAGVVTDYFDACHGKGPTLLVMKLVDGRLLFGYRALPIDGGASSYRTDCSAKVGTLHRQYLQQEGSDCTKAVVDYRPYYGPTWGFGHDVKVATDMKTVAVRLGYTHQCPPAPPSAPTSAPPSAPPAEEPLPCDGNATTPEIEELEVWYGATTVLPPAAPPTLPPSHSVGTTSSPSM